MIQQKCIPLVYIILESRIKNQLTFQYHQIHDSVPFQSTDESDSIVKKTKNKQRLLSLIQDNGIKNFPPGNFESHLELFSKKIMTIVLKYAPLVPYECVLTPSLIMNASKW